MEGAFDAGKHQHPSSGVRFSYKENNTHVHHLMCISRLIYVSWVSGTLHWTDRSGAQIAKLGLVYSHMHIWVSCVLIYSLNSEACTVCKERLILSLSLSLSFLFLLHLSLRVTHNVVNIIRAVLDNQTVTNIIGTTN